MNYALPKTLDETILCYVSTSFSLLCLLDIGVEMNYALPKTLD
jgi:hypothetical protein